MKVKDIRGVNVCVPLSTFGNFEPVTMWYGTRYAALKTIIFIDTDEGITGLGEAWAPADGHLRGLRQFYYWYDYPEKYSWKASQWPYRKEMAEEYPPEGSG